VADPSTAVHTSNSAGARFLSRTNPQGNPFPAIPQPRRFWPRPADFSTACGFARTSATGMGVSEGGQAACGHFGSGMEIAYRHSNKSLARWRDLASPPGAESTARRDWGPRCGRGETVHSSSRAQRVIPSPRRHPQRCCLWAPKSFPRRRQRQRRVEAVPTLVRAHHRVNTLSHWERAGVRACRSAAHHGIDEKLDVSASGAAVAIHVRPTGRSKVTAGSALGLCVSIQTPHSEVLRLFTAFYAKNIPEIRK